MPFTAYFSIKMHNFSRFNTKKVVTSYIIYKISIDRHIDKKVTTIQNMLVEFKKKDKLQNITQKYQVRK